jgi:hypothetical protein
MPACKDCSSAISFILDAELQKSVNASGQSYRRTMLKLQQNSKLCDFCKFIASEIHIFARKKDLNVEDDRTVEMFGDWKTYRLGSNQHCSRILESIIFSVYNVDNVSREWTVGRYPVCIKSGVLPIPGC